jgi:hypothetical protein
VKPGKYSTTCVSVYVLRYARLLLAAYNRATPPTEDLRANVVLERAGLHGTGVGWAGVQEVDRRRWQSRNLN